MPILTFPDGNTRSYDCDITGSAVVNAIAISLAKKTLAMKLDGVVCDLSTTITKDAKIEFILRENKDALELIRHDAAHVMAEAVQALYPNTQVTIGPVIENGFYYDFYRETPFTPDDFPKIEAKMREIIGRNKPFTKQIVSRDEAVQIFADKGEKFKVELVAAIPDNQSINLYDQGGWFDLCRGPHLVSTGQIGTAFKLMKVAGAYWRGDSKNPMLTRIYATAWRNDDELKLYLHQLEEAEKRDHRKLGREMDLFHFQEEGPGTVFWHQKGWALFQNLIAYMRRRQREQGYVEVNTPQVLDRSLWEQSGHWGNYHANMFITQTEDERVFALKPMNCPGHVQIFKNDLRSYRDLPMRIAEFGMVHRYEPSGALHGLMRVRAFTQDDAHIFCTQEQIATECLRINTMVLSIYKHFGFDKIMIKLSTRPEKRVGDDVLWDKAEEAMRSVLQQIADENPDIITGINEGEGAFYGPKFEYTLKDAIGREWQCGTTQVDFNLPARFGATYISNTSEKTQPVMIHQANFGSLERFTGILIENTAGHFPLWLSPQQIKVCTVTGEMDDYVHEIVTLLNKAGLKAEADLRNEKISYKVREHSLTKTPVIMIIGKREMEERRVSIRRLGSQEQTGMSLDEAITSLTKEATPPDLR